VDRRILLSLRVACASACVVLGLARNVLAAPNDADAQKLRHDAVYTDYLATNFADAAKKMEQGVALCRGPADCAPAVRARLMCDLGVVYFALQRPDEGRAQFAAALKEDPSVALDGDLATADLQREFTAVKSKGSGPSVDAGAAPAAAASTPQSDMAHSPPASQAVLTPLPIYVELPEGIQATKVYVRYQPFGAKEWKTAYMSKVGGGYGVELPCADVGDSPGVLKYFIQAVDAAGDLVASSGRLSDTYRVKIVQRLDGEAPRLPGHQPPAACAAATDCPPEFPGCHETKQTSAACVSDDECAQGQSCVDGACSGAEVAAPPPLAPYKKNWLSLGFQEDALLMPSASDACAGGTGYTCFGSDGSYYADLPLAGADDQVNGGLRLATMRVLFGYDRALTQNLMLGGRVGFALGGGPQRPSASGFMPLHLEARASYWFGDDPLARSGFRFFALAAGGAAQIDAGVPVDVYANQQAYMQQQSQSYQAWKKTGLGFVALGGGAMFAITPATGVLLELKALETFPTNATGFGAQMGYVVGL
jgi:hypothetical protein